MIISTGMRTDIPAFYSKWFINRIKAGFVCVRNPYNEHQITKYKLDPSVVDCICFCTKNPIPMLKYLDDELAKFRQFWFVTITPYGKEIEPNVEDKQKIIDAFKILSSKVGKNAVGWRYDPIFYGEGWTIERHIAEFEKIAKELCGYTNYCVISILDLYEKIKRAIPNIYPLSKDEQLELLAVFVKIARQNDMVVKGCYEGEFLREVGVDCSGCQTKEAIELAIGEKLSVPKAKNARGVCNCLLGQDIGAYNSCLHLCKYCYANGDKEAIISNYKKHNPNSPLLIGEIIEDDKVVEASQQSYINNQISFFD